MSESTDTALHTLAERICAAAGTDLATVLRDIRDGHTDPATPPALRAGWNTPDTRTATLDSEAAA